MKVYYTGRFIKNNSNYISSPTFKLKLSSPLYQYVTKLDNENLKLNPDDFDYLKKYLNDWAHTYSEITDKELYRIFSTLSNNGFFTTNVNSPTIIFEIVEDIDGNFYGKEILSGYLFPLRKDPITKFYYNYNNDYSIAAINLYKNENVARFAYILNNDGVASNDEVNDYLNLKKNTTRYNNHILDITKYYNKNVFNTEIILKEKKQNERQNEITKIMEDIEFVLVLLKQYNYNLYLKYNNRYKELCDKSINSLDKCVFPKTEFLYLLSNIKLSLLIKEQNCDNIIEYLNIIIENYLNNNTKNDNITINDIDNFTEIFLKSKDDYDIQEQREILKKISLLYLLITKSNINNINEDSLNEGYFKDNIKSIILSVVTLIELGIVNNNISIDELKDTSITNIFNIIKKLEFNKLENNKIKKLIKQKEYL